VSDDSAGYPGAPPGWYADPAGGPGQRWWDGYSWTEATALPAVPPPPPAPMPTPTVVPAYPSNLPPPPSAHGAPQSWLPATRNARDLVGEELRISPLARIAIAFPAVLTVVYLIGWVAIASQWRSYGHQFHLALNAAQNHQTVPVPSAPEAFGGYSVLLFLCAVAAIVVECVWQFRAASAARAMGLPAKRSPGWGVGLWFIPVVNLWMPYQAIRDCLASDDPNRAMVLRYWLLYVGMAVGAGLTIIGLMTSTPVGVVFALGSGLCALGVLATAPQVVRCIAAAHRAAVTL
jgi:hypothetical protein